jgi:hypothetical protein
MSVGCVCIDNVYTACIIELQPTKGLIMENVKVELHLNDVYFEYLWDSSMAWQGTDWAAQDGRFEPMPDYSKKWAYFFDEFTSALIALSYLESRGEVATLHSDETGGWLIVSDFASPCHR